MANSTNVTFENSSSICPYCRTPVRIPNGTYNFDKHGLISMFNGLAISADSLLKLKQLTQKAKSEHLNPEEYKAEAIKISPGVAKLFTSTQFEEKFWKVASSPVTGNFIAFLGFLLAVLAYYKSKGQSGGNTTINNYFNSPSSKKNIHPNKRCPCRSGRRFKNCHGKAMSA